MGQNRSITIRLMIWLNLILKIIRKNTSKVPLHKDQSKKYLVVIFLILELYFSLHVGQSAFLLISASTVLDWESKSEKSINT